MDITLTITDEGRVQVAVGGTVSHSFDPAPLVPDAQLRERAFVQEPAREGAQLFDALFPPGSVAREALAELDARQEPGHVTLVATHPDAQAIPWEFLCDEQGEFLVARHRFVRGLPPDRRRSPPEDVPLSQLQILAVPASPLCRRDGTPVTQLDVIGDVEGLAEAVRASGAPFCLRAVIPPTLDRLQWELASRRPTLLHFSGHGAAVSGGPTVLLFEDEAGVGDLVTAERLLKHRGEYLFLVFLSACQSATAYQRAFSNLAYELVAGGVPYALGMQFSVAETVATRFAEFFYRYLAEGHPVEEAVRQARLALERYPGALGIPVLYAGHAGAGARVLPEGKGEADVHLWPPEPGLAELPTAPHFQGYQVELATLGALWRDDASVLTVLGEGGIGKTALAVEAAHRFRWRFPEGVLGLSLDPVPAPPALLARLAEWVWGGIPDERWDQRRLLDEAAGQLRRQERLLVLDNYEGVVHAAENDPAAGAVRRLARRLLGGNTRLLLTSREPGDVQGEQTVRLGGLSPEAGAALFRALAPDKGWRWDSGTGTFADESALRDLSREVGGHPLALEILASAYAAGRESLESFRHHLAERLREARLVCPDQPQHATMAACLGTSLDGLDQEARALLPRLTLFQAPFPSEIAAGVFDDASVVDRLHRLGRASLVQPLEVAAMGEEAILYRLHPVVRMLLEAEVDEADLEPFRPRYVAAYTRFAVGVRMRFTALGSRLVRLLLPDLERALAWAEGGNWSLLAFNMAGLWRNYGVLDEAMQLYEEVLAIDEALGDQQGKSATLHAMAYIYRVRGDLDEAMQLYGEALAIMEALGDQRGKAVTLGEMASVYSTRGEYDRALELNQEKLTIVRELGDQREISVALHNVANIYTMRGDLDEAMQLYGDALAIDEALGDQKGKSATLHEMAYIYTVRGDLDEAMQLYGDALAIDEALGDQRGKAVTLGEMASVYFTRGEYDRALELNQEKLTIIRELGDQRETSVALHNVANIYRVRGDLDEAMRLYGEALAIAEALGDQQGKAVTLGEMASVYFTRGEYDRALELNQEKLTIVRELGDQREISVALYNVANIYTVRGDLDEAMRLYGESLTIQEALGDQQGKSATLAMMGQLLAQRGEHREALRAFLTSLSILVRLQAAPDAARVAQIIAGFRQEVGAARFQALWAEVAGEEPLPAWLDGEGP